MKLSYADLLMILGDATRRWVAHPHGGALPGMTKALTEGEMRALVLVEATLMVLNRKGLVLPDAIEPIEIEYRDSLPETEGYDSEASNTDKDP